MNIVRVEKKQTKDLDVKRDKKNDFPREPMGDTRGEKRKSIIANASVKDRGTLTDLSKKYEVSEETTKKLLKQELGTKKNREQFLAPRKTSNLMKEQNNELIKRENERKKENGIADIQEYTSQDIKDQLFKESSKEEGSRSLAENLRESIRHSNNELQDFVREQVGSLVREWVIKQPRAEPLSKPRSERSRELQELKEMMELIEVLEKARKLYEITGKKKFEVKVGNKRYRFRLK